MQTKKLREHNVYSKMDFLYYQGMMTLASLPYVGSKEKQQFWGKRLIAGMRNYKNVMTVQYFQWHNESHETKVLHAMIPHMVADELELFDFDLRKLD